MPRLAPIAALSIAVLAAACDDFRSPAEIVEPQLFGVRAVPPAVAPGEQARLEFLIADVDGPRADIPASWAVIEGPGGAEPLGTVAATESGVVYTAPDEVDVDGDEPAIAAIEAVIELPHREVVAVKTLRVGEPRENPRIERVTLDGEGIDERGEVAAGSEVELDVTADIPLDRVNDVSWAATAGELELFLRTPVTWVIPDDAGGTAWLYVAIRDGEGGGDWAAFPIDVAPAQ